MLVLKALKVSVGAQIPSKQVAYNELSLSGSGETLLEHISRDYY